MNASPESMDDRIARVHGAGMIDLHFDLPMFLYDHRNRDNVLADDFLSEFEAGDIGTVAAGIYIEDQYVPEQRAGSGAGASGANLRGSRNAAIGSPSVARMRRSNARVSREKLGF